MPLVTQYVNRYKKLSKARIYKRIQSDGSFGRWLANFHKKALTNVAISLARESLPVLVSNLASNAIKKFERKISGNILKS